MIARHVAAELPFMATENLMMAACPARRRPPGPPRVGSGPTRSPPPPGSRGATASMTWPDRLAQRPEPSPGVDLAAVLDPRQFVGRSARAGRRVPRVAKIGPIRERWPPRGSSASAATSTSDRDRVEPPRRRGRQIQRDVESPGRELVSRASESQSVLGGSGPCLAAQLFSSKSGRRSTQTRAACRALRSRLSSSRRRRSLGFS